MTEHAYSASSSTRIWPALAVGLVFVCSVVMASPAWMPLAVAQQQAIQKLETETVTAVTATGRFDFVTEIADQPEEHAKGLMFREAMAANEGMLFDFGQTRPVSMWMKNTPLSLDMVFARADGTVARIEERTEPFSERIIRSGEPVSHVLELRGGVARMIGLKPGDRLEHRSFDQ